MGTDPEQGGELGYSKAAYFCVYFHEAALSSNAALTFPFFQDVSHKARFFVLLREMFL